MIITKPKVQSHPSHACPLYKTYVTPWAYSGLSFPPQMYHANNKCAEKTQTANKHMKRCLKSLAIREIEIQTMVITAQPLGWL